MAKKSTELVEQTIAPITPIEQEERAFVLLQQKAKMLTESTMIPDIYRGETNVGNVIIAMEMANRIGVPALAIMQNMNVIYGKPSFSTAFLIAGINNTGKFSTLNYELTTTAPKGASAAEVLQQTKCRCFAYEKEDTERKNPLYGSWVTMQMAKDEGWIDKKGSKWKTMPEQMLRYRAATLWQRTYCPEVTMGMQTDDEIRDSFGQSEGGNNSKLRNIREAMNRASSDIPPTIDVLPMEEEMYNENNNEA